MPRRKNKRPTHSNARFRLYTTYLREGESLKKIKKSIHHRLPVCRGGILSRGNCVIVDNLSHKAFNALVVIASKLSGIPEKDVYAYHIANALNDITQIFNYAISVDIHKVFKNSFTLDTRKDFEYQKLLRFVSRVAHILPRDVTLEDLIYVVEKIRLIARIISIRRGVMTRPDKLVDQFNEIWLPKSNPMFLRYSAKRVANRLQVKNRR